MESEVMAVINDHFILCRSIGIRWALFCSEIVEAIIHGIVNTSPLPKLK